MVEGVISIELLDRASLKRTRQEGLDTLMGLITARQCGDFSIRLLQSCGYPDELEDGLEQFAEALEDWVSESAFGWGKPCAVVVPNHDHLTLTSIDALVTARPDPSGSSAGRTWTVSVA
jgi:hypothetical protein